MKRKLIVGFLTLCSIATVCPSVYASTDHYTDSSVTGADSGWSDWDANWADTAADFTKVSLTPGADDTQLNFAWYSEKSDSAATPVVHFGTDKDNLETFEIFDTGVAFLAGMMIIPAVFVFLGTDGMASGPSLIFISLPKVFDSMGVLGQPVAIAFFLMMGFAALTSCVSVMETLVANCMELYHKPRKKMCGAVGIYSLITAVVICLGYNKLYFELKLPNGSVGQLLDVMDYISNSFLMPFISLLTSILIGWVIGPDWIIGEVERNGEHFKRAGLYRFMIRYIVPVVMLILFLVSTGFANLIF